jgi:hypothetical protein
MRGSRRRQAKFEIRRAALQHVTTWCAGIISRRRSAAKAGRMPHGAASGERRRIAAWKSASRTVCLARQACQRLNAAEVVATRRWRQTSGGALRLRRNGAGAHQKKA